MNLARKVFSFLLAISLTVATICCYAEANTEASDYLAEYGAALIATDTKGKYDLFFDITATDTSDSLGISQVKIYKSNGTYVTTIQGTTKNGLICEGSCSHTGVYTRYGTSGVSYYAEVTFFAERGGGSDSRTITTNTITVK